MNDRLTKVIEASYLTSENFKRYRLIMTFFYQQHRRMNDLLYRTDVLHYMQEELGVNQYSEKEVDRDLNQLVEWENISTRQEMSRPKSIEEYKNRHFRYQITERSIAIEEMLESLEKISVSKHGALDKNTFNRFLETLLLFQQVETAELAVNVWQDAKSHFTNIRNNTSDYIGYLNSESAEIQMQAESFLVYKDQFILYLRDFVSTMQNTYHQICACFEKITDEVLRAVYQGVLEAEKKIPRLDGSSLDEQLFYDEFYSTFRIMASWFMDQPDKISEYTSLIKQTNQAISRITRLIQRYSDRLNTYRSRKKDYEKIGEWFLSCSDIEECHRMFTYLFGTQHSRHYYTKPFPSASKYSDIWELEPTVYETTPRVQNYRKKTKATTFKLNKEAKEKALADYLKETMALKEEIETYVENGLIQIERYENVPIRIRQVLLKWLSLSLQQAEKVNEQTVIQGVISTYFDYRVKVTINRVESMEVNYEDGRLVMPKVTYELMKEEPEADEARAN